MKFKFTINDNGMLPLVQIDDAWLVIVSLTYAWKTKTDQVDDGANICIVDGYLHGETVLRRFVFDIFNNSATEVRPENESWRVFEVCVDKGTSPESEVWVKTPQTDLKVGNIIRILDAVQYHHALDGCGVWIVTDIKDIEQGRVEVRPYKEESTTK